MSLLLLLFYITIIIIIFSLLPTDISVFIFPKHMYLLPVKTQFGD